VGCYPSGLAGYFHGLVDSWKYDLLVLHAGRKQSSRYDCYGLDRIYLVGVGDVKRYTLNKAARAEKYSLLNPTLQCLRTTDLSEMASMASFGSQSSSCLFLPGQSV
jgi:hypothetical protein